jgi:hypothetical protein
LADGRLGEQEKRYIDGLRKRMGMEAAEFVRLVEDVRSEGKKLALSREGEKARAVVRLLARTAAADGVVDEKERRLLGRIAAYTGLGDEVIERMLVEELSSASDSGGSTESSGESTPTAGQAGKAKDAPNDTAVEARLREIYAEFTGWDAATRQRKVDELADWGRHAVVPLLRILESYRNPDGSDNALELKDMVIRKLGELKDERAVYYLVQQVSIGDVEDEITNLSLRAAAAEALGKITGHDFSPDQAGIEAARQWWTKGGAERNKYDKLAM